jgi:hypothetical protein
MTETIATQSPPEDSQPTGTSPTEPSPQDTRSRGERSLTGFLAAMVAIYGILTAVVIFSASRAEGLYYDKVFIAQAHLNDASELSLEAQINILHDLSVWRQIDTLNFSGSDPELIELLYGYFTAEAQASMERSGGPDDIYAEEMFSVHKVEREMADRSFELAGAWSERANTYETLATALAVGLAFAAWASLIEKTGSTRWMFTIVAALILVGSLGFLGVHLITREPLEEYDTFTGDEDYTSIEEGSDLAGGLYVHPSGAFEFVIPAGWELAEEDEVSALISDGESLAGAEFSDVERVYTEDEMRAHATDFIDATVEDDQYEINVLDVQPESTYAGVTLTFDGSVYRADFFLDQQETAIFVFFFATSPDTHEKMLPTRDEIRGTFRSDPEAARAANP